MKSRAVHTHTTVFHGQTAADIQEKKSEILGLLIHYPEQGKLIFMSDENLPEGHALKTLNQFVSYTPAPLPEEGK
jgi:hypothetical protein